MRAVGVQSHPWTEWSRWSPAWSQLHAAAAEPSFFLTADWVETWLEVFGTALQPRILVFSEGDSQASDLVGICLLSFQTFSKRPLPAGLPPLEGSLAEYRAFRARDVPGI